MVSLKITENNIIKVLLKHGASLAEEITKWIL
jgi:hypothetical protein